LDGLKHDEDYQKGGRRYEGLGETSVVGVMDGSNLQSTKEGAMKAVTRR
jgi:hypothetical protein